MLHPDCCCTPADCCTRWLLLHTLTYCFAESRMSHPTFSGAVSLAVHMAVSLAVHMAVSLAVYTAVQMTVSLAVHMAVSLACRWL